jgi:type I restriction enzyme S subunit
MISAVNIAKSCTERTMDSTWDPDTPRNGWKFTRMKWVVSKIGSGKTPRGGGETYSSSGILFLRSQNVHFAGLRLDDVVYIDEAIDREMETTRVQPDDVLLNITGASLARCCLVPQELPPANVNQHVCILRPRSDLIRPAFLHAVISSHGVQSQIFSSENGVSREGLNYTQTANLMFAVPQSIEVQQRIVNFLNRETAKINALIAKKQRLIELLQEKRTALVSHAVSGWPKIT